MTSTPDPHAYLDEQMSGFGRAKTRLKGEVARALGRVAAACLTPRALEFPDVRARLWRRGIAAQPKGFYASLIDPANLTDRAPTACHGMDFGRERHRHLLQSVFPKYRNEYAGLSLERPAGWDASPRFFLDNDAFMGIDALAYWGLIREYRPARVVELGSGFSTLLAAEAVRANGEGRVTAIDPFPREFIRRNDLGIEVIAEAAEELSSDVVLGLEANDIVFVDSSHVIRQGGEVVWFFHEVLPRLKPGVIVHVHDIHLPFEYPVLLMKTRNVYWTEQFLLQSYLTKNRVDQVLFGSCYAGLEFEDETRAAFPMLKDIHGASFWFQVG